MIVFDIETIPQDGLEASPAWANHQKRVMRAGDPRPTIEDAALIPEFGQIICIAARYCNPATGRTFTTFEMGTFGSPERSLLALFCAFLSGCNDDQLAGHYIKGFDIPFVAKRCLANGIRIPDQMRVAGRKPWEICHLDTAELLQFGGPRRPSLDATCHLLGLKSPKDDISGDKVYEYYKDGRQADILRYCMGDRDAVYNILERLYATGAIQ